MSKAKGISHALARILRHAPEQYGVKLDKHGWARLNALPSALQQLNPKYSIDRESLATLIDNDPVFSRFEVCDNRCCARALYGHSVPIDMSDRIAAPPRWLYHGTSREALDKIYLEGLTPQDRQFVHMRELYKDALSHAVKKHKDPIVLEIRTRTCDSCDSESEDVVFYQADATRARVAQQERSVQLVDYRSAPTTRHQVDQQSGVWLTKYVPPEHIFIVKEASYKKLDK